MVSIEKQLKLAKANNTKEKVYEDNLKKNIRKNYKQDKIEAKILNFIEYLLEPDNPENAKYLVEMKELINSRREIKQKTKKDFEI